MSATSGHAPALEHIGVGIDTARFGHRVSFLRPDRNPAAKPLTVMESHDGYQTLQSQLEALHRKHPHAQFQVRIDAAGQYAANLERFLRGLDQLPLVISIGEPKRNKDYQKAHFPKRTTDDTESQAMARFAVVELPKATHATTPEMEILREVAGRLQAQVKQSTQAVNRFHNLLARVFPEFATITNNLAAGWALHLFDKYPSAARIAQARLASLEAIPYLPQDKAESLHLAAKQSVGSLKGDVAETLVRDLVAQVRQSQSAEQKMRALLDAAYAALPPSGHLRLTTIPGFGAATAAVLTAKIIDIDRFPSPNHLVGCFGVFPEENRSGVDKQGKSLPPGTLQMSDKGNDLVRAYLWNAAMSAIRHNPAVRALYRRLRAKGKRGDIALGHCMRKLLHIAYAVWKTDTPFDPNHFPWENPNAAAELPTAAGDVAAAPIPTSAILATPVAGEPSVAPIAACVPPAAIDNEKAVGHKRDVPAEKVVTTAASSLDPIPALVNPPAAATGQRPAIDFAYIRAQISIDKVLRQLGFLDSMRGGRQRRGPCPIHGRPDDGSRCFSAHCGKNIFRCFDAGCAAQGNVLDLWAAVKKLPLYEAALDLEQTFNLARNREEEPVK